MNDDEYPYRSPPDAKTWQPVWPPASPLTAEGELDGALGWIIALALAILACGNLVMLPIGDSLDPAKPGFAFVLGISFVCFAAGSIVGQGALLAILLVFGPGPLWQRLAGHVALAAMASLMWGIGFVHVNWRDMEHWGEATFMVALCLPLLLLFCQVVPWFFRLFLHWRIEFSIRNSQPLPVFVAERLSIRDYLVGTSLVAVTMALVRAGKPASMPDPNYWSLWITIGLVLAALSLIAVVPIVYFTLGMRRSWWGVVGVLALTGLASVPAIWLLRGVPLPPVPLIIAIPALMGGFTGTVAVPLWIARACGYRLVTERPLMSPFDPAPSEAAVA